MASTTAWAEWLDTSHPQLRLVHHDAILPPDALPTFNSHAIESALHKVPDLAEQFVYLNDDFFLGRPLIKCLTPAGACALSALAGVIRWAILAQSVSVWAIVLAEPLHGFTFALQHLVSMRLIETTVPAHLAATAQAVYGTLAIGAVYAALMLASGWLYAQFGAHGFWVMAGLCAAALPVATKLPRA